MQFQWSKKKYTLRDLIAQCKDTLPVVISVAEGYTGSDGDDTHDISGGSVFFVYAVEVQSRIVALTEDERYLSMARSCPVNFHIIHKDRSLSEPYRLDDIVLHENNNLGDLRIQMAAPDDGGLGPMDAGSSDIQGTLRVLDLYDERYLLCHSFIEGSFCETGVVSIPSYLPLAVVFATGCKNGSRTDFKEFLNQVNASSLKCQQEYAKQPRNAEEIVVFSDPPNGDYEYIETTATSNRVSRSPSFKIVDTTRSPEREAALQLKSPTETSIDAVRHEEGELFLTVPRLPPRNTPRRSSPVGRPRLEEKVADSRVTWTTPGRRPLPPLPDLIGRGSSVTEECWGGDERVIVDRKQEEVKKSILPLKKESRFQKRDSSPSPSPKFSSKFGKIPSGMSEVSSDSEALPRGRTTGHASRTKAPSSTSGKKPEVQKTNQSATWSPWPFTSLKRNVEKSKLQKFRPPVPKKPSFQPTVAKFPTLTSRSSTGTFTEPDESFLDVSQNSAQRPGTLTLGGQLDSSSGYDGDFESYYDEIKSPMTRDRLSGVADDDVKPNGTDEDTHQWDSASGSIPSRLDSLSLRSTDTTGRHSDTESGDLDSSYEQISLRSSSSRTSETGLDSGVSSAPTNVSTPTLLNSGVHNFINDKRDPPKPSRKDIGDDARLVFTESLSQVCRPPPPLQAFKRTWRNADDLPVDIVSLSVEQVSACLTVLNLGQYVRTFREQQIDGALLSCLDKDVLVSDFGFRKFDAIKLAKFARDGWRPKVDDEDTHC